MDRVRVHFWQPGLFIRDRQDERHADVLVEAEATEQVANRG